MSNHMLPIEKTKIWMKLDLCSVDDRIENSAITCDGRNTDFFLHNMLLLILHLEYKLYWNS